MAVAFGKQVIDTGPCTDPTNNFQELANVLEALGNPYSDPEGIEDPWTGANFTEGCGITITATPGEYNIATKRKPGGNIECDEEGLYTTVTGGGPTYTGGVDIEITAANVINYTGAAYIGGTDIEVVEGDPNVINYTGTGGGGEVLEAILVTSASAASVSSNSVVAGTGFGQVLRWNGGTGWAVPTPFADWVVAVHNMSQTPVAGPIPMIGLKRQASATQEIVYVLCNWDMAGLPRHDSDYLQGPYHQQLHDDYQLGGNRCPQ
jgi:hypothetical protein